MNSDKFVDEQKYRDDPEDEDEYEEDEDVLGEDDEISASGKSKITDIEENTVSSSNSTSEARKLRKSVLKDEERAVRKVRILVGGSVAICGIVVTIAVYLLAKATSDKVIFEQDYESFVKNIRSLVRWEVRYNFALMEQLSASTTLDAKLMNSTFPFNTNPSYEITGGFVDGMGGIMSAAIAPLVTEEQRQQWIQYTLENQGWIENSAYLKAVHPVHRDALHGTIQDHEHDRRRRLIELEVFSSNTESSSNSTPATTTSVPPASTNNDTTSPSSDASSSKPKQSISNEIYRYENGKKVPELHQPGQIYAPLWQVSPADYGAVNCNLLSDPRVASLYLAMLKANTGVLSSNFEVQELFDFLFDPEEKIFKKDPHAFILQPVYDAIIEPENQKTVGFLIGITPFGNLLDRLLPEGREGVIAVFKDDCGNTMTFEMSSTKAQFLGYEDLHETQYDQYERVEENLEMYKERIDGVCTHDLYLYPSSKLEESYNSRKPILYTALVALAFSVVLGLFVLYDYVVTRRQNRTIVAALSSQAIVRSLFPDSVGRQLISDAQKEEDKRSSMKSKKSQFDIINNPISINNNNGESAANRRTNAKLYPQATVIFADLVGFTAWSSMREPCHVFTLLETLYADFDKMAVLRRVFKVETVGDCYVAVSGLPEPQKLHHINVARFARDCLTRIVPLLEVLGRELGPDTVDLGVRIGIHSGPITAGVLRGDRARFQLFGDTVNTAARHESTGAKNRIQVSRETADLLIGSGKGHWLRKREDTVYAKGKGELETYWLMVKDEATEATSQSGESLSSEHGPDRLGVGFSSKNVQLETKGLQKLVQSNYSSVNYANLDEKNKRLANWNTEILKKLLLDIIVSRNVKRTKPDAEQRIKAMENKILRQGSTGAIVLDELQEIIALPEEGKTNMDSNADRKHAAAIADAKLTEKAQEQLHDYCVAIALLYRKNSFHSFSRLYNDNPFHNFIFVNKRTLFLLVCYVTNDSSC